MTEVFVPRWPTEKDLDIRDILGLVMMKGFLEIAMLEWVFCIKPHLPHRKVWKTCHSLIRHKMIRKPSAHVKSFVVSLLSFVPEVRYAAVQLDELNAMGSIEPWSSRGQMAARNQ